MKSLYDFSDCQKIKRKSVGVERKSRENPGGQRFSVRLIDADDARRIGCMASLSLFDLLSLLLCSTSTVLVLVQYYIVSPDAMHYFDL